MIKIFLSVFLQEYFMVDKRNRILQTEKHQDTGGDMSVKCGFWRKNTFFLRNHQENHKKSASYQKNKSALL